MDECVHIHQPAGRVSAPEPYVPGQRHASVYVCRRPEDIAEARQLVADLTGHPGVFVPFEVTR